jgi:competence protein ComEA
MSSSAGLGSQLVSKDPPPAGADSVIPWSWPAGARALLAGVVIVAALGLAIAGRNVRATSAPPEPFPELVLDVNTAPLRALAALPHLGPTLALRLDEARAERPFQSMNDVRDRVRGIGPVTLARIAPHLRIEPEHPVGPVHLAGSPSDRPGLARRKKTRASRRASASRATELVAQAQKRDTPPAVSLSPRD